MAVKNATFDSYDLQDANIILTKIEHDNIPAQELKRYRIVRGDGEIITDKRFGAKRILLIGRVNGSSSADLESRLDTLREKVIGYNKVNKELVIDYNATTRQYTAVCTAFSVDRRTGTVNFAEFQIEFVSTTPFGKAPASSNLLTSTGQTTSPNNKAITVAGTAEKQKLVITVELNSFTTADDSNTITLENSDTGYAISISRVWTATEILVVDVENFSVTVDGTEVDYSGAFPDFAPGSRTLIYTDDFSARNVDITVDSTVRYL